MLQLVNHEQRLPPTLLLQLGRNFVINNQGHASTLLLQLQGQSNQKAEDSCHNVAASALG